MEVSERLRRWLPLAGLLVFVAGLALGPMAESDLFFRIQAGRDILARHGLPGRNLYSFTYPDHPDLDAAWLFEVGVAALHARGGFAAIVIAKAALLVATFAGAFAVCLRRGAGPVAAALALAAAAFAGSERFVERPHLFSLAGVVGVLAVIDVAAAGGLTLALAGVALAGVVLWANLHAGVFLAPALLALGAAGARLERAPGAARLALLAAGAALATFATPLGLGIVTYLRLNATLPVLHPVDEFRAATWISDGPLLVHGALAFAAALALRPRAWRWVLPAAALGVLALRSVRFGADFALVAAPLVAVGLSRLAARRVPVGSSLLPSTLAALLLGGLALAPRLVAARAGGRFVDVGLDTSAVPLDALRFAEDNGLRDRMYNDFEIGSYLLFEGYPRHRVFVDPRLPAYPAAFHALLGRYDLTRDEWDAALAEHGVQTALLAYAGLNRRVSWFDPARWALVYRAHDARLFVRRTPRFAALIAAREIPATFSFTVTEGTATVPLDSPPAQSPVAACEWQRRLGDLTLDLDGVMSPRAKAAYAAALAAPVGCLAPVEDARLAAFMGALELGAERPAEALVLLDRARAHGDADLATLVNRAVALERLSRRTAAAAAYEEIAARPDATDAIRAHAKARGAALH